MKLAVVGMGMVSPAGLTPQDNVFFLRASAAPTLASPFLDENDAPIAVGYCPWIRADASMEERLVQLSTQALDEALMVLSEGGGAGKMRVLACVSKPRPGFDAAESESFEHALISHSPGAKVRMFPGAAGAFTALREADEALSRGDAQTIAVVAADSFVTLDAITHEIENPPSPWRKDLPRPAEGGAALVLMTPTQARRSGVAVLGTIEHSGTAMGTATDANDETVDGAAMTTLLAGLPAAEPIVSVFGQSGVDSLREREWHCAVARNAARFDPGCAMVSVETSIGRIGAAAGVFQLVYGIAMLRHDALDNPRARRAPFAAWAISTDGTRGLAVGRVEV